MNFKAGFELLKLAGKDWMDDKAPRLAAALAYYTLFSIAPLLLVSISIAGLAFGAEAARGEIVHAFQSVTGEAAAKAIEEMIANAGKEKEGGIIALILGTLTLLFGASGVFTQLKDAFNEIWEVPPKKSGGIIGAIKDKFLSFAMVLGVGFLLLVSLVVSAGLSAMGSFMESRLPGGETIWQIANVAISFAVVTGLFALMFRYLPDRHVEWRYVWGGAAFTSFLFVLGKFGIGMYLGRSGTSSAFGAAGSLVIVLVWIYYSGLILFFGAEITEVSSRKDRELYAAGTQPWMSPRDSSVNKAHHPRLRPANALSSKGARATKRGGMLAAGTGGLLAGALIGVIAVLGTLINGFRKLMTMK